MWLVLLRPLVLLLALLGLLGSRGLHLGLQLSLLCLKLGAPPRSALNVLDVGLGNKVVLGFRALAALVVVARLLREVELVEEQRLRLDGPHQLEKVGAAFGPPADWVCGGRARVRQGCEGCGRGRSGSAMLVAVKGRETEAGCGDTQRVTRTHRHTQAGTHTQAHTGTHTQAHRHTYTHTQC